MCGSEVHDSSDVTAVGMIEGVAGPVPHYRPQWSALASSGAVSRSESNASRCAVGSTRQVFEPITSQNGPSNKKA